MATYVNDLRLTELATGEGSGTWGTTTNTNLELIGEALGYGTQNCFASDADATTTVADGVSDPARSMYFKVTSSATLTATRTLTIAPNTVSRVMFIENATTGSQSINISQGSGANVTIATGKTAVVYLDGAGSTAAVVDAMALVDPGVTDTLAEVLVAGNTSSGTNIELTTTDKVQFRDSAIYLNSSADGQLDIVADTEVQIATTTVDLNGILDVSGNTTLGADVTFTGASYNVVWDSSDSALEFADNAKAVFGASNDLQIYHNGSHSFINDTGTGDLRVLAANFAVYDAAGTNLRIKAFDSGATKLYDGTTGEKLATTSSGIDVTGTAVTDGLTVDGATTINRAILSSTASDPALEISARTDSSNIDFKFTDTDGSVVVDQVHHKSEYYATDGTQVSAKVRTEYADVSGGMNYVISTSGAGVAVRDRIKVASTGDITFFDNDGTTTSLFYDANAGLTINEAGADRDFRVESNGNTHMLFVDAGNNHLGIGESAPSELIHATQNGGDAVLLLENTGTSATDDANIQLKTTNGTFTIQNDRSIGTSGALTFAGNTSNNIVIDHDTGQVGVNLNAPQSAFHINQDGGPQASGDMTTGLIVSNGTAGTAMQMGTNDSGGYGYIKSAYVNSSQTGRPLLLYTGTTKAVSLESSETVINDDSVSRDFRVESDSNTHALFVDAGLNNVGILTGSPNSAYALTIGGSIEGLYVNDDAALNKITSTFGYSVSENAATTTFRLGNLAGQGAKALFRFVGSVGYGDPHMGVYFIECALGNADDEVQANVWRQGYPGTFNGFQATNAEFLVYTDKQASTNFDFWIKIGHFVRGDFFVEAVQGATVYFDNSGSATIPGTAVITNTTSNPSFLGEKIDIFSQNSAQTDLRENVEFTYDTTVFNQDSNDQDFRVESDSASHMLFVDAGNNRIGINDSSPSYTLDVNGNIHATSTVIIGDSSSSPGTLTLNDNSGTAYTLAFTGTGTRAFQMQGSASSGAYGLTMTNLGTGAFNLSVDGVLTVGESTSPFSNDALTIRGQQDGTAIKFEAGGTHRFDLDCNGTGTDNLSFNNTTGAKLLTIYRASEIVVNEDGASSVDFRAESDSNTHMLFVDAGENQVYIGNSTGIASGTPAKAPLEVVAGGSQNAVNTQVVTAGFTCFASTGATTTGGDAYNFGVMVNSSGSVVGTIVVNHSSTAYNTTSDYRLKENVTGLTNATNRLKQLQPKRFNFIEVPDATIDGFLAHEVSDIVPEAVSGTKDAVDADGKPIYQGIDQSKLVPLLVATIQELEARIAALESN